MKYFLLAAIIITTCLAQLDNRPALKVALRPEVLNGFKDAYFPYVIDQVKSAPIPDIPRKDMKLTHIVLKTLDIKTENVIIEPKDGYVYVLMYDVDLILTMVGETTIFFIDFEVDLVASASNSSFSMEIRSYYRDNELSFKVRNVKVTLQNTNLETTSSLAEGQVDDMVQSGEFEEMFTKTLSTQLKDQTEGTLNSATKDLPNRYDLPYAPLTVDYTQTENLNIGTTHVTSQMVGAFYPTKTGYKPALRKDLQPPAKFPNFNPDSSKPIQIFISNYLLNSALYNMWDSKLMTVNASNPDLAKLAADTVKGLGIEYNDERSHIYCSHSEDHPPSINFNVNGLAGKISGSCAVYIWKEEDWSEVASADVELEFDGFVSLKGNNLLVTVEHPPTIHINSVHSPFKENVEPGLVEDEINTVLSHYLPYSQDFPLPKISQVDLKDAEVNYFEDYVQIGASGDFATFTGVPKSVPVAVPKP